MPKDCEGLQAIAHLGQKEDRLDILIAQQTNENEALSLCLYFLFFLFCFCVCVCVCVCVNEMCCKVANEK